MVLVKPAVVQYNHSQIKEELEYLLKKANLLKNVEKTSPKNN